MGVMATMNLSRITIAAAALSLAAAAPAVATKPDDPGSKGKAKGNAKAKNVVLKGLVVSSDATTVTVTVKKATKWGRALRDTDVQFTVAKVVAADTNADGKVDTLDLAAGDKVVVQARIGKTDVAPFAARRVVDQTHPKEADEDAGDDAPVEASAG
jgi:hypothetical protein